MLKITLTSGLVGKQKTQRRVVTALGLGKYGSTVVHADSPTIRGMINKVHHLVTVVPAEGDHQPKAKAKTKPVAKKADADGEKKPTAAKKAAAHAAPAAAKGKK
jgi:large subunit ribosomal protein L30